MLHLGLIGRDDQRGRLGMFLHRFEVAVLDGLGGLTLNLAATCYDTDDGLRPGQLALPPTSSSEFVTASR